MRQQKCAYPNCDIPCMNNIALHYTVCSSQTLLHIKSSVILRANYINLIIYKVSIENMNTLLEILTHSLHKSQFM